ncbi:TPA: hypothetical protein ACJG8Q_002791, partial [Salmonella enterica subsp. diarizonae serovar 61:i:z]
MRYILFVFILMGGLISFNSSAVDFDNSTAIEGDEFYSYQGGECSVNINPVYGSYVYFLSHGLPHIVLDGCDYVSYDGLDPGDKEVSSGLFSSYSQYWYPTGNKASQVIQDKPLKANNSCSSSSPPLTGAYTFIVIDGTVHANINNCDYILPKGSPIPVYMPLPDGGVSVQDEGPWYPTGATGIGVSQKPQPVVVSPIHNPVHEKYEEQLNRYCSQSGKCSPDEDGEGMYPIDDSDFLDFVKKDDAAHNKPAENPADKPLDSGSPAGNTPVSYAEQLRRY